MRNRISVCCWVEATTHSERIANSHQSKQKKHREVTPQQSERTLTVNTRIDEAVAEHKKHDVSAHATKRVAAPKICSQMHRRTDIGPVALACGAWWSLEQHRQQQEHAHMWGTARCGVRTQQQQQQQKQPRVEVS
jgi:hypothetical protein